MTKKKTTKKRTARKPAVKQVRQPTRYQLAGKLSDNIKSPQQLLIRDAMQKLGAATAADIAEQVTNKLQTKQTPQRVVAFYLAAWKKVGIVKAVA
jgi:hypothetical protein